MIYELPGRLNRRFTFMLQGVEMRNFHSQETGRSMVEMLGVLAIVGVLSVGGIAGYSQAMSKFKVTKAMDQVQTIIQNIRTLYASQRRYSSLKGESAYQIGILTDENYDSESKQGLNPFGGSITFGATESGRSFLLSYSGLTTEACVKMATADWGADESSGLLSITIGAAMNDEATTAPAGTSFTWNDANNSLPVDVATATTACSTTNAVTWEYR